MLNVSRLIWILCPGRAGNVNEQGAGQTLQAVLDVLKNPDQRLVFVELGRIT